MKTKESKQYPCFKELSVKNINDRLYRVVLKLESMDGQVTYRFRDDLLTVALEMKSEGHRLYQFVKRFQNLEQATAFLYTSECPCCIDELNGTGVWSIKVPKPSDMKIQYVSGEKPLNEEKIEAKSLLSPLKFYPNFTGTEEEKVKAIEACVDYIFDTENEDFYENPSENHVYYIVLLLSFGKEYAEKILKEAK